MYLTLVNMLRKKELQPCVVFTFSKKRCEQVGWQLDNGGVL